MKPYAIIYKYILIIMYIPIYVCEYLHLYVPM